MKQIPVSFPCGELTLEGEWLFPEGDGPFPAVVVSHPYPPMGGNMQNGVVTAIWQSLAAENIAALRFNFRGVGGSGGKFAEGVGEREDVRAALEFALAADNVDTDRVGLAGYSFGSMMSAPVAITDKRVKCLALVSSPLSEDNWQKLDAWDKPHLAVVGEKDEMVSVDLFRKQMAKNTGYGQYRIITGGDHGLFGYEEEIGGIVAEFFAGIFNK